MLSIVMPHSLSSKISGTVLLAMLTAVGFFIYPAFWADRAATSEYVSEGFEENAFKVNTPEKQLLPEKVLIDVPFSAQAPFGNWAQPWQDACEETSVLMAVAWARGFRLDSAFAAEEILKQVEFEERVFGYHRDTNLVDTARLIKDFYRYSNFEVRYDNVTIEDIKKELLSGNLVIVPFAGEILKNQYFTSPPRYHMAVVRGYDDSTKEFIVNEPGTKYGNGFRYSYDNLMEATHDWTGSADTVMGGKKAMIVFRPIRK